MSAIGQERRSERDRVEQLLPSFADGKTVKRRHAAFFTCHLETRQRQPGGFEKIGRRVASAVAKRNPEDEVLAVREANR